MAEGRQGLQRFMLTGVRDVGTEIGRGSYAAVVELQFRGLKCAGKKLHRPLYDNASHHEQERMLQRFETECEILSELKHPHVVQFLGVHFEEGSMLPVLVMEFLQTTLTACVDRYGALPQEISYTVLDDVATALCYLHGQTPAIIHRDLSANNVLLTSDMGAKISDLGVAKILNLTPAERTQMTTCPGTQSYMPPEALAHNPTYDTKMDCFSYGVMILHMLCGRWPLPDEANRVNPNNPHQLIPISEVERRKGYLEEIGEDHSLIALIRECLSNYPPHRPDAEEILRRVREVAIQFPPSFKNRAEMLRQHRVDVADKERLSTELEQFAEQLQHYRSEISQMELAHSVEVKQAHTERDVLTELLKEKDQEIAAAAQEKEDLMSLLETKDQEIAAKEQQLEVKTLEIQAKQEEVTTKQQEVSVKDAILSKKEATIKFLHNQFSQVQDYLLSKGEHQQMQLHFKRCADLPIASSKFSCVVIDDVVYVGGCGESKVIYTYTENEWNGLPACPVMCFGLGKLFGRVLTVGGVASRKVTADVYMFSKESQEWVKGIPPMPTARSFPTIVSHESAIAACGGFSVYSPNDKVETDKVEVLKGDSCQWFTKAPLPSPRSRPQSTIVGSFCYFLGGYIFFKQLVRSKSVWCVTLEDLFDTTSPKYQEPDLWQSLPDCPTMIPASANLGGALVTIGGTTGRDICNTVCAYARSTQSWVGLGNLPSHCIGAGAASLPDGKVMLIGGCTGLFIDLMWETNIVWLVTLQSYSPNL